MKHCNKCDQDKDDSCFYVRKTGTLYGWCKECTKADANRYRDENRERVNRESLARSRKNRDDRKPLYDRFRKDGCYCCPEKRHFCLSAHHVDPSQKEYEISKLIRNNGSNETVIKEFRKCVCVCHNCHAAIHANDIPCPPLRPFEI